MPRPDTGNFNRFLTSLGLVLLVAALVVPYFYFQSTDTLRIPAKELNGLTKTSRDVLRGRQDAIADLEPWVLVFAGLLAGIGVCFLFTGGRRLRQAQESEEEEGELRKSRARAEIRRLTPEQLEDKRDEQAREAVEGTVRASQPKPAAAAAVPRRATPRLPTRAGKSPNADPDKRYRERREAIARIEEKLLKTLSGEEKFESYEFLGNVMVSFSGSKRPIEIDGLFEAKPRGSRSDVVLEIKLWGEGAASMSRMHADTLLATIARYRAISEHSTTGWLVMVVPEGQVTEQDVGRVESRLTDWIKPVGAATIVREADLDGLGEKFKELVGSGALTSE